VDHLNDEYHEPKGMLIDVKIEFVEIIKDIENKVLMNIEIIPFYKKKIT